MKKITLIILFVITSVNAQIDYVYFSGGLDPKIALIGTENQYTEHDNGIDYLGKFGLRFQDKSEVSGYVEVYDEIGYRAIGISYGKSISINSFDFIPSLETSIISRRERSDGFNEQWIEYMPSLGLNAEARWNISKRFAIGYIANYKTRPDLVSYGDWSNYEWGTKVRFSTYIQIYIKL